MPDPIIDNAAVNDANNNVENVVVDNNVVAETVNNDNADTTATTTDIANGTVVSTNQKLKLTNDQRYEVNANGQYVVDVPVTLTQQRRKDLIKALFARNGWNYTLVNEVANNHFLIRVDNPNLGESIELNIFHGNIRKEDPTRAKSEKKIQLGANIDPRQFKENGLILGFYVNDAAASIEDVIVVSWPIEDDKNYGGNPSLRVSMDTDILLAKNKGYYVDRDTVKELISLRPEFIYKLLEDRLGIHSHVEEERHSIIHNTGYASDYPRNRIIFGAPGTGKSFKLDEDKDRLLEHGGVVERVTFYPDYTYSNFVGTYKPVSDKDENGKDIIRYEFVPGPFMRLYVKALKNSRSGCVEPHLIIIEEINRANMAAVFGDIFQLLDRKASTNVSKYSIQPGEDLKKYLKKELGEPADNYNELRLPDNMFIWATMNSADQGVFPMDTAFKRRWDFSYLGINKNDVKIAGKKVVLGKNENARNVEWNELRIAINNELSTYRGVSEDKLIGPFFFEEDIVPVVDREIDADKFIQAFKDKVIMYLFEDAAKQKISSLFKGCLKPNEERNLRYSEICDLFEEKGVYIFCEAISKKFNDIPTTENSESKENNPQSVLAEESIDGDQATGNNNEETVNSTQG